MSEWKPVSDARADGTLCSLLFWDAFGPYEGKGPFFLHDDGHWYRVDPPTRVAQGKVSRWRIFTSPTPEKKEGEDGPGVA